MSARRVKRSCGQCFALAAAGLVAQPALAEETWLQPGILYVADVSAVPFGGIDRGLNYMGLLEASLDADAGAFGLEGTELHASLQYVHGRSLSEALVGDAQVVSNIDAVDAVRLFEAWAKVPVARKGFVKAGLVDLNGDFDVQNVGALFLNSSHGIGPDFSQSGLNGPSIFPTTAAAVVGGWQEDAWSIRLGLFDAVSGDPDRPRRTIVRLPGESGLLMVGEVDFRIAENAKLQVGAWGYTSRFETIDPAGPPERSGNSGAYAMVEGRVGSFGGEAVDAWLRIGIAEDEINPIGTYVGGGVAVGDEDSRWGLAVAHARLGDPAFRNAAMAPERAETAVELTYSRQMTDRVRLQPDIQYVINPGWDASLDDALVLGVRMEVSFF